MRLPRVQKLWQRNVLAAVVAAAAATVFVVTDLLPEWTKYHHTVVPEHVIPAGATGTVDGRTWRIDGVRHLNKAPTPRPQPLPDGTVLQIVTIERSGAAVPGESCAGVITDGRRRWNAEWNSGYGMVPPEGSTDNCTKAGPVQFSFLLPGDAVPTAVDVTAPDGQISLRLEL